MYFMDHQEKLDVLLGFFPVILHNSYNLSSCTDMRKDFSIYYSNISSLFGKTEIYF